MNALRPYQVTALDSMRDATSAVLQMPTGAGKTLTAAEFVGSLTGTVWFVGHRREIVRQASLALTACGIDHALASPGKRHDTSKRIQVCSIGAMKRRMLKYPAPSTIIYDECHHIGARTWSALQDAFPDARHIGLTATPVRLDGQGLAHWFDELIVGPSIAELIQQGYLSRYKLYAPSQPDLAEVPVRRGDYAPADADKVMNDPRIIGDAVEHYQLHASGKRALAFTTSVAASVALVDRFNAAGIPSAHIDGTTPVAKRDAAVADLASGKIQVLSNFGVFTEGFDLPSIDAVILLRPTKSVGMYLQMVGRSLRIADGKPYAIILDHAGLVHEHGFPDADRSWSLEGGDRRARTATKRKPMVFTCPDCGRSHAPAVACPECGHKYPPKKVADATAGMLEELRADEETIAAELAEQENAARVIEEAMATFVPVAAFGRIIHRTPSGVYKMIAEGLPINDDGEVQVSAGLAWFEARPQPRRKPRVAKPKPRKWWQWRAARS
jgi:DNA repair protein RadD